MDALLTYRGRSITFAEVAFIRELIAAHPGANRRKLSLELCAAWGWVQPNGKMRDAVCRGLLLLLHRAGHIELPTPRWVARRPRRRCVLLPVPEVDRTPLQMSLTELGELIIQQVRRAPEEALLNSLIAAHHYLGYTQPVGEQLKFLVTAGQRPVACFTWSSAARHLGPRDRFIGWSREARRENIRFVVYNSRYLIMPWVRVPHLASHLLGRMVRILSGEWERLYGHQVYFLETFVHPERYRGTCYRAANWVWLGQTTGRGKDDQTHRANRPVKDVLGYPLVKDFRERLGGTT